MTVTNSGVYLAFGGGPDASNPDGPGIGPYDEIVLRGARAVGENGGLGRIIALRSSAGRWRDAETESSSAVSEQDEIGGVDLRFSAGADEIVVRFSDDQVAGQSSVPDLGPFAAVVVGSHEVRGDDETLAVRVSRISPWQLTDRAGAAFQGTMKDALVFVASSRSAASRPRPSAAIPGPAPSQAPDDDPAPSVWVDRAKPAPNIYISRPDRKR